ncbi:MAG: helix-turn-helix domain-containing protein [Clostridia bacterium]|nr:helix-turn-helix domain-containing protein [Clostridia bacterium]
MFIQTDNFGFEDSFRSRTHKGLYSYPVHIHQFSELVIAKSGGIEILTDSGTVNISEGDIAIIPPFAPHGFHSSESGEVFIAVFSPSLLKEYAASVSGASRIYFTPSKELFSYALSKLERGSRGSVCAGIYALAEEFSEKVPRGSSGKTNALFSRLFEYLAEHYKEDVSLSAAAAEIGYSVSYISHTLGSIPGMSFTALLSGIRIDTAKRLLVSTELPVSRVALECGFGSERSFHRAFSRLVDKTPLEYRKSLIQG